MKAVVKIGTVYKTGTWGNETYFESDEEYLIETDDILKLERALRKEYNGIYQIYTKHNGVVVACVY